MQPVCPACGTVCNNETPGHTGWTLCKVKYAEALEAFRVAWELGIPTDPMDPPPLDRTKVYELEQCRLHRINFLKRTNQ